MKSYLKGNSNPSKKHTSLKFIFRLKKEVNIGIGLCVDTCGLTRLRKIQRNDNWSSFYCVCILGSFHVNGQNLS